MYYCKSIEDLNKHGIDSCNNDLDKIDLIYDSEGFKESIYVINEWSKKKKKTQIF